jgi:hypothetical protein
MLRAMMFADLAQLATGAPRQPVEFHDAAVLLQAARVGLLDEEVGVVLDRHGPRRYRRGGPESVTRRTLRRGPGGAAPKA